MLNDPYEALGLTKTASADEIAKAYRKLARTSHPDLHPNDPGAEERFKTISVAYEVLKHPETRARYDAGEIDGPGAENPQRQYFRDFADASDNAYQQKSGFGPDADPADIFAEILRNCARHPGGDGFTDRGFASSGMDVRYLLEVPFLDAVRGAETRITLPDGKNLAVKSPRGTDDGQILRLRGRGMPRDGDDILLTLPITIDEAILGDKVTTPTIDGPVGATIPPATNSGRILRLQGRGVARAGRKTKGDQRVELRIVVPPDTDERLRDFLSEWRKTHAFDPRTDLLKGAEA